MYSRVLKCKKYKVDGNETSWRPADVHQSLPGIDRPRYPAIHAGSCQPIPSHPMIRRHHDLPD